MDDRRVADYFVIAGLPPRDRVPLDDFSQDGAILKATHNQAPITDITVIFPGLGEETPAEYSMIETTPTGHPANLNHGSLRSPNVFICYRRGNDKPPLVDVGVYYEGKERVMEDSDVVKETPYNRPANVNNSQSHTFITYRRAKETDPCTSLVVTDICVILLNKGENPPHAFCTIDKNLNKGIVGSDVYLCYKKSMNRPKSIAYKPATLGRFPVKDHSDFPLPPNVPLFCLPMGANIERWPSQARCPEPVFSTFVFTVSEAVEKVYGAAVTFYESFPEEKLTAEDRAQLNISNQSDLKQATISVNKCMCILSHWPFFDTIHRFLLYLHKMSLSGPHSVPIERYISHFMQEVPFPSLQRPRIFIELNANSTIPLAQPQDSPLPLSGASFKELLQALGPDNCLTILLFALTEQKILVHSLRPDVLTRVAEAIAMLIFPFHWQCPYIPLCPLGLSDVLCAPMPFIVGVDSRYFDLFDPPADVFCIDLDTNSISHCDDKKYLTSKLLPKKPAKVLRNTLMQLCEKIAGMSRLEPSKSDEIDFSYGAIDGYFKEKKRENVIETEIQEAFLYFMATILKGFRGCLRPITSKPTIGSTDPNALFDIHGFLKSRDKAHHRFYNLVMKTQMFTRFIEERSFVTDKDASLAFFDECTEKVDSGEGRDVRLIESDELHQSERTFFVPQPDATGLVPGETYSYRHLECLNPQLFSFSQKKKKNLLSVSNRTSPAPSSPMARRTKQEIRSAQKLAQKQAKDPREWVKCLKSYSFYLWFIHLPAYVKETRKKTEALKSAFDVLFRMEYTRLQPFDEVCYRVLMQLCGQYGHPILAIKLLTNMRSNGIQPNAITYGYYNKAVLESKWPSPQTNTANLWKNLRNVILGVAQFRQGLKNRPLSIYSESDAASSESGIPDEGGGNGVKLKDCQDLAKSDDHESTGALSDVGYSSMNLDETQKSSSSINSGSQIHSDSTDSDKADMTGSNGTEIKEPRSSHRLSREEPVRKSSKGSKLDSVDFTESNEFRLRVGSIVRSSECSLASMNNINLMRGSTTDSSAGLLIAGGHSMYDEVFLEDDVTDPDWRKRHSSDYGDQDDESSNNRTRHNSGSSQKPSSMVQECELSTELLRSCSYGNDTRILSHLSKSGGSTDDLDSSLFGEDCLTKSGLLESTISDGGTAAKATRTVSPPSTSTIKNNSSSFGGNRSPIVPLKRGLSGVISPQMTPVTKDDPLGLFRADSPLNSVASNHQSTKMLSSKSYESPASVGFQSPVSKELFREELFRSEPKRRSVNMGRSSKGRLLVTGTGAKVPRSASFCNSPQHILQNAINHFPTLDGKQAYGHNSLHRSYTVPDSANLIGQDKANGSADGGPMSPFLNQISALSSRLQSFSPRKSESPLLGGFNQFGAWASSKLSKIQESISTTSFSSVPNTPSKSNNLPKPYEMEKKLLLEDDEVVESISRRNSSSAEYVKNCKLEKTVADDDSRSANLERIRPKNTSSLPSIGSESSSEPPREIFIEPHTPRIPSAPTNKHVTASTALEVQMTSCSRCHSCQGLLYDEEIMSNWTPEESNLNTRCAFCNFKVVPVLTIIVKDYRSEASGHCVISPAQSTESMQSAQSLSALSSGTSRKPSVSLDPCQQEPVQQYVADDEKSNKGGTIYENTEIGFQAMTDVNSVLSNNIVSVSENSSNGETNSLIPSTAKGSDNDIPSGKMQQPLVAALENGNGVSGATMGDCLHKDNLKSRVNELKTRSLPSSVSSSTADICSDGNGGASNRFVPVEVLDSIIVPYLSPIVLRKELENVLEDEGDNCLTQAEFVDKHPIIFWNLLWYCTRINVPTHLPELCLKSEAVNKQRSVPKNWLSAKSSNVLVRCMWDNPKLHEESGQPMYLTWTSNTMQSSLVHALVTETGPINRGTIQQIISGIQCDDISSPLKIILNELRKKGCSSKGRHFSTYRDILFLSISVLGRKNIDLLSYDREYYRAFSQLTPSQRHLLHRSDYPPTEGAILCRQFFGSLELPELES